MKIIILGTTEVGFTLAENLVSEKNDITVIDTNIERLRDLQNRFDIRAMRGLGSYPDVLQDAGAEDTDMLIAVTDSDEINMLACQVAYTLFHIPQKIARIRSPHYLARKDLFAPEAMPVDVCISPEQLVSRYITRLIERPGALQVLDFFGGKVQMVAVKIESDQPIVGSTLRDLEECIKDLNGHIAAIFRHIKPLNLTDNLNLQVGDEVFFIAASSDIESVMRVFRQKKKRYKNIMLAGGGMVGSLVAKQLENNFRVKVIEHNKNRAKFLSIELGKSLVLLGDATDPDLLLNENIDKMDVFCALTNDDEDNIMSCLQAKRLGVSQVIALVARSAYADLIEGGGIDIVVSPQNATTSSILAYIRQGDIVTVHALRKGAAEAIEIIVHGDEKTSNIVGRTISEIKLPKGVTIGVIVRDDKVILPGMDLIIKAEDHIIVFLVDKLKMKELERLFQVKVTFI